MLWDFEKYFIEQIEDLVIPMHGMNTMILKQQNSAGKEKVET
jgi:hypothetical protein